MKPSFDPCGRSLYERDEMFETQVFMKAEPLPPSKKATGMKHTDLAKMAPPVPNSNTLPPLEPEDWTILKEEAKELIKKLIKKEMDQEIEPNPVFNMSPEEALALAKQANEMYPAPSRATLTDPVIEISLKVEGLELKKIQYQAKEPISLYAVALLTKGLVSEFAETSVSYLHKSISGLFLLMKCKCDSPDISPVRSSNGPEQVCSRCRLRVEGS